MSKSQLSETVADAIGTPTPGAALQQAREQQGISLEQVADRIKISVAQLSALEKGDIDRLPGLAFARGYVRTYSRFLGLDADALVMLFNALYGEGSQRQVKTINRVKPQAHLGDPMIRISVVVFILILLGSSVWWWQTQMEGGASLVGAITAVSSALIKPDSADLPAKGLDAVPLVTEVDQPTAKNQTSESAGGEPEPEYLSEAEVSRLARELENEASATTSLAESAGVTAIDSTDDPGAVESAVLVLRFSGECWISIKDASSKVIFASLMQDGNTLERNLDSLPVELLIGQVGAIVQSEFRGKPLDLAQYGKKGVARLTLE